MNSDGRGKTPKIAEVQQAGGTTGGRSKAAKVLKAVVCSCSVAQAHLAIRSSVIEHSVTGKTRRLMGQMVEYLVDGMCCSQTGLTGGPAPS